VRFLRDDFGSRQTQAIHFGKDDIHNGAFIPGRIWTGRRDQASGKLKKFFLVLINQVEDHVTMDFDRIRNRSPSLSSGTASRTAITPLRIMEMIAFNSKFTDGRAAIADAKFALGTILNTPLAAKEIAAHLSELFVAEPPGMSGWCDRFCGPRLQVETFGRSEPLGFLSDAIFVNLS
jgi:hypothetical protein